MKNARITKKYFDEPLDFKGEIGGDKVFKSITKSAINFFIYKGGESEYIKHLIPYLDEKEKRDVVWFHYPETDIYIPKKEEVSHIIRVIGTNKMLYAYIELFNAHKYIIKLNEDYTGSDINESYVYDVFERTEISRVVPLSYSREQIVDFLHNKNVKPFQKVQDCYTRILTVSDKRQTSIQVEKLVDITLKRVQEKYQNGIPITKKVLEETMNEVLSDRGYTGSAQQKL